MASLDTTPATDIVVVADDRGWLDALVAAQRWNHRVRGADSIALAVETSADRPTLIVVRPSDPAAAIDTLRGLGLDQPTLSVVLVARDVTVDLLRSAMLVGVGDVLTDGAPDDTRLWQEVLDAAQRLADQTAPVGDEPGKIVLCTSAVGAEGATSVACNLAVSLARSSRRVVLVEGDHRFGDVRETMGLLGATTGGKTTDRRFSSTWLGPYLHRHMASGVTVMLPPHELTTIEDFPSRTVVEALGVLQTRAEIIVVDAPFWVTETHRLPAFADLTLLISKDAPRHLAKARTAARVLKPYAPTTRLVISNYLDGRTPKRKDLAIALGLETIARLPETADLGAFAAEGTPIVVAEPTSGYAGAVGELAESVLAWSAPEQA